MGGLMAKKDSIEQDNKIKEEKISKEDTKRLKKINELLAYYNDYKDNNCTKESIKETRNELFIRLFDKSNIKEINDNMELVLDDNKKLKIKDYKSYEEIENILDTSKDAFLFLLYDKNKKPSIVLDIVGFIILTILGIGIINAGKYIFGIIFILCYVALYLVTFTKDRK